MLHFTPYFKTVNELTKTFANCLIVLDTAVQFTHIYYSIVAFILATLNASSECRQIVASIGCSINLDIQIVLSFCNYSDKVKILQAYIQQN